MRASTYETSEPPELVALLLRELPTAGTAWPKERRDLWLKTLANISEVVYGSES